MKQLASPGTIIGIHSMLASENSQSRDTSSPTAWPRGPRRARVSGILGELANAPSYPRATDWHVAIIQARLPVDSLNHAGVSVSRDAGAYHQWFCARAMSLVMFAVST